MQANAVSGPSEGPGWQDLPARLPGWPARPRGTWDKGAALACNKVDRFYIIPAWASIMGGYIYVCINEDRKHVF